MIDLRAGVGVGKQPLDSFSDTSRRIAPGTRAGHSGCSRVMEGFDG